MGCPAEDGVDVAFGAVGGAVPAAAGGDEDAFAEVVGRDGGAGGDDGADAVGEEGGGEGDCGVEVLADEVVAVVEGGGVELDCDFVRLRGGEREVAEFESAGVSGAAGCGGGRVRGEGEGCGGRRRARGGGADG